MSDANSSFSLNFSHCIPLQAIYPEIFLSPTEDFFYTSLPPMYQYGAQKGDFFLETEDSPSFIFSKGGRLCAGKSPLFRATSYILSQRRLFLGAEKTFLYYLLDQEKAESLPYSK